MVKPRPPPATADSGLNHKQRQALGACCSYNNNNNGGASSSPSSCWIWQDRFVDLHPGPVPGAIIAGGDDDEEEEEQTYRQFISMGQREPNERGTGRWKLDDDDDDGTGRGRRTTIGILPERALFEEGDGPGATSSNNRVEQIRAYFAAFFHGLDIVVLPPIEIDVVTAAVVGPSRKKKQKKNSKLTTAAPHHVVTLRGSTGHTTTHTLDSVVVHETLHLEVFSILDALMTSYVRDDCYCFVALTQRPLVEREYVDDGDSYHAGGDANVIFHEVQGRACGGDRVCCVSTHGVHSLRTLLATATHETLHCFGLDHCCTFACLMNAVSVDDDETLTLSPLNLKKWVCGVLGYAKDDRKARDYVVKRYEELEQCFVVLGLRSDAAWVRRKLDLLRASST